MRRALGALGVAAAMSIWWVMAFPGQALAEVTGPCTAQVGGVDVTDGFDTPGNAIDVPADQQLQVAGTAEGRVTGLVYTVHIAGGGVNVGNVALGENGRNWNGTVDLTEFSWAGVGIFEVTAEVADRRRRVLRPRLPLHRRTEPSHHRRRRRRGGGRDGRSPSPRDVAAAIEAARLCSGDRAGFRGGCDDCARCGSGAPAVLRRPADARDGGGGAGRCRRHGFRRVVRAASRRPRRRSSRGAAAGTGRRAGGSWSRR